MGSRGRPKTLSDTTRASESESHLALLALSKMQTGVCGPVDKIPVWRERGSVLTPEGLREASTGEWFWVGKCGCGIASQAETPEGAQEAVVEACALTKKYNMEAK